MLFGKFIIFISGENNRFPKDINLRNILLNNI